MRRGGVKKEVHARIESEHGWAWRGDGICVNAGLSRCFGIGEVQNACFELTGTSIALLGGAEKVCS